MPHPDPTVTERVNNLLTHMTLAEKAHQVVGVMPNALFGPDGLNPAAAQRTLGLGIGHISNASIGVGSPLELARVVNGIQHYLLEATRMKIPAIVHAEALNGLVSAGYTAFPTAIGLAATWDPQTVQAMADIIRVQMRSVGVLQALSPVMDIARDPRWGRVHETYGEDVYLASAFSVAFVRGLQGEDLREGVLATGKHFLGYAMTEAGQNMAATHFGPREVYDVYATPFEAAIKLAGLGSVMNSYSEVDGVPAGASRALLTDLLRDRMGFDGSVVSDYSTVEWLHTRQRVAESLAEAGRLAITAGLDIELPNPAGYGALLEQSVADGSLPERVLDTAVGRVLADKVKLGLFERPFVPEDPIVIEEVATRGRELSTTLAARSITLVKNDGILPLDRSASIAVIGPNAEAAMVNFSAYTYPGMLDMLKGMLTGESRMAGVENMMAAAGDGEASEGYEAMVTAMAELQAVDTEQVARYGYGALPLVDAIRAAAPEAVVMSVPGVAIRADDPRDIAAAVRAAEAADVVVLAVGGRGGWFGTRITEGEGTDTASIELPAHQVELARAVAATGTPLVGVLHQGRPYAFSEIDGLLNAALIAYFPGPAGPAAVASVLYGDTNPSGKLPYTIPRATGQIPIYVGQKRGSGHRRGPGDMFRGYIDLELEPLYPFGHGLGYSAFAYDGLYLDQLTVPADGGTVTISVRVRNTGTRRGAEVAQFYVSDMATGVTRPEIQLVGFGRVELDAGESAVVRCTVEAAQLGYTGVDGLFVLEPGPIDVLVGGSSADLDLRATFDVTGEPVDLAGRRSYLSRTWVEQ